MSLGYHLQVMGSRRIVVLKNNKMFVLCLSALILKCFYGRPELTSHIITNPFSVLTWQKMQSGLAAESESSP